MALEATSKVDAIGIQKTTDEAVLTLIDEKDWANESQHLQMLQDKLNAYLRFIESGELLDTYPQAKGRRIRIDAHFKYPLPASGKQFLDQAAEAIDEGGYGFSYNEHVTDEQS